MSSILQPSSTALFFLLPPYFHPLCNSRDFNTHTLTLVIIASFRVLRSASFTLCRGFTFSAPTIPPLRCPLTAQPQPPPAEAAAHTTASKAAQHTEKYNQPAPFSTPQNATFLSTPPGVLYHSSMPPRHCWVRRQTAPPRSWGVGRGGG